MSASMPTRETVPDRGADLRNVLWALTGLALATALLRIYVRLRNRLFGWDDIFMAITMGCFIAWSAILTLYTLRGGAQHVEDVRLRGEENFVYIQFLNWMSQVFGIAGVALGKVSVSVLLLNIIGLAGMQWLRYYLWAVTIVLTAIIGAACSILTMSQCRPAERLWDSRVDGTCLAPEIMSRFGTFAGVWNTFADASLALIPISIFWRLKCSFNEKLQLSIVFGLNILTSICSGIKTKYLSQLANRTDFTWATYDIFVWVTAELFLIVVCGTIPVLLVSIRSAINKVRSSVSASVRSRGGTKDTGEFDNVLNSFQLHTGSQGATTTTVARGRGSESGESKDGLVGDGAHKGASSGVRVELSYDVRTDRLSQA